LLISIVGIRRYLEIMGLRLGGCCSANDGTSLPVAVQAGAGVAVSAVPAATERVLWGVVRGL